MTANLDIKIHTRTHTHIHIYLVNNLILAIQKTLIHINERFFKLSFKRSGGGRTTYSRIQRIIKLWT